MKKFIIACVVALLCACEPITPELIVTDTKDDQPTVDYVLTVDSASESFHLVDIERNGLDYVLTFQLNEEEKQQLVTNCDRFNNLKHSTVTSPEQVIKVCNKNGIGTLVCADVTIKLFYTWRVAFSDYVKIDIVGKVNGHSFSFRSYEVPTMN